MTQVSHPVQLTICTSLERISRETANKKALDVLAVPPRIKGNQTYYVKSKKKFQKKVDMGINP